MPNNSVLNSYPKYNQETVYNYEENSLKLNMYKGVDGLIHLEVQYLEPTTNIWVTAYKNINSMYAKVIEKKYNNEKKDTSSDILYYNYSLLDLDIMYMLMSIGVIKKGYKKVYYFKRGNETYSLLEGGTVIYAFDIQYNVPVEEFTTEEESIFNAVEDLNYPDSGLYTPVSPSTGEDNNQQIKTTLVTGVQDYLGKLHKSHGATALQGDNVKYAKSFHYTEGTETSRGYAPIIDSLDVNTFSDCNCKDKINTLRYKICSVLADDKCLGLSCFRLMLLDKESDLNIVVGKSLVQFYKDIKNEIDYYLMVRNYQTAKGIQNLLDCIKDSISVTNQDGTRNILIPHSVLGIGLVGVLFDTNIICKEPTVTKEFKSKTGEKKVYSIFKLNYRVL